MTNQKNRFFTLVFSCCPGAGEMYFGLYRHGVSLMGLFFGIAAFAFWLHLEEVLLFLPVIWCYSFFHTHNLRRLTSEEFAAVKDEFFWSAYVQVGMDWELPRRHWRLFSVALLVMGFSFLWQTGMELLSTYFELPRIFWQFGRMIPEMAAGLAVLWLGFHLWKVGKGEQREAVQMQDL